eukprot:4198432-Prorocentrum_lima.AAC.1
MPDQYTPGEAIRQYTPPRVTPACLYVVGMLSDTSLLQWQFQKASQNQDNNLKVRRVHIKCMHALSHALQ